MRQLERQIASLYFERSGLSRDKEQLAAMVKATRRQTPGGSIIQSEIMALDFLNEYG